MEKQTLFSMSVEDVQFYAEIYLGRRLTRFELYRVAKDLGYGLGHDLDVVLNTAIQEAVNY